jgi:hypothetical protein
MLGHLVNRGNIFNKGEESKFQFHYKRVLKLI